MEHPTIRTSVATVLCKQNKKRTVSSRKLWE